MIIYIGGGLCGRSVCGASDIEYLLRGGSCRMVFNLNPCPWPAGLATGLLSVVPVCCHRTISVMSLVVRL